MYQSTQIAERILLDIYGEPLTLRPEPLWDGYTLGQSARTLAGRRRQWPVEVAILPGYPAFRSS